MEHAGIILDKGSANESMQWIVTPTSIGWAHTQNDPCISKFVSSYIGFTYYRGALTIAITNNT